MSAYQINSASVVYDTQNTTLFSHGLFGDCYSNIMGTATMMFLFTQYQPVFMSIIGSIIVGLSGLFPLLILPVDDTVSLKTGREYLTIHATYFLPTYPILDIIKYLIESLMVLLESNIGMLCGNRHITRCDCIHR